jgi:hypothetical protein
MPLTDKVSFRWRALRETSLCRWTRSPVAALASTHAVDGENALSETFHDDQPIVAVGPDEPGVAVERNFATKSPMVESLVFSLKAGNNPGRDG